jgi:hypothetical protein
MKLRFVLAAVAVALLAFGGEGLYNAARSRRQSAMTCDAFARQRPAESWVRLTDCSLDYGSPGYREANGQIEEIFFPVRPAGQLRTQPAAILAATQDPAALAIVQGTTAEGRQPNRETVTVMMLRVVTPLRASREIEGLARAGRIEVALTRRALTSFSVPLAPHYDVIDLHARPDFIVPGVEAGVGLAGLLMVFLAGRRWRAPAISAAPEPIVSLPPALLLNLDASAGTGAIEQAPPLGSRDEVAARLARALGDRVPFDAGRATFHRPDVTIQIDIGDGEPVWTATVRASGPGAASSLRALAGTTGWRVYVPKTGAFLDTTN